MAVGHDALAAEPAASRPDAAVRRTAELLRDAGWRVWADLPDPGERRPFEVPGERYVRIPAIYAETGRVRRLVSVAADGAIDTRRRRDLAAAARRWAPRGSYVVVSVDGPEPVAARWIVSATDPPEEDPLAAIGGAGAAPVPTEGVDFPSR